MEGIVKSAVGRHGPKDGVCAEVERAWFSVDRGALASTCAEVVNEGYSNFAQGDEIGKWTAIFQAWHYSDSEWNVRYVMNDYVV